MNMFDRMIRVVTSNVNNVLKQLEDPEKYYPFSFMKFVLFLINYLLPKKSDRTGCH